MGGRGPALGDVVVSEERDPWQGRSVLLTGAAGLLGTWVARALVERDARVVGLDLETFAWSVDGHPGAMEGVQGDIRDRRLVGEVLDGRSVDTVIHLAAQPIVGPANEDPVPTFEANIEGTWALLEELRRRPRISSIVVASSDKAYGDTGGRPCEETMPLAARHPYAASKACADLIAQTYAASFDLPVVITRCSNLYGGWDLNWSRLVPGTIRSALRGEAPVIRSDGTFVRDYLYAPDGASGVLAAARAAWERPELRGEAFNFSAEEAFSVLEVVDRILELTGADLDPQIRNESVNEIPEQRVSSAKARKVFGWRPGHSFDEGLKHTIAWYTDHLATS